MNNQRRIVARVRDDVLARRRTWYYQSLALWAKRKEKDDPSLEKETNSFFGGEYNGFVHSNR